MEEDSQKENLMEGQGEYGEQKKLTFFERTFGKLHPGGVRGSIFVLIATALGLFNKKSKYFLGPGCLTLPCSYRDSGLVWGTIFVMISGIMSYAALYFLFIASKVTKTSSFAQCAVAILGYPYGIIIQCVIFLYAFFCMVAYQIMSKNKNFLIFLLVSNILNKFFEICGTSGTLDDADSIYTKLMNIVICAAVFPLCLKRDLKSLNYVATCGVISVFYVVIVVLVQTGKYSEITWEQYSMKWAKYNWDFPSSFTYACFAFTCYTVVFQVRGELQKPTEKRINKVIQRAVIVEIGVYLLLACAGYISLLAATPHVLISRPQIDAYPKDIAMQISRILMSLIIFFGIPLNLNPCKQAILIFHKGILKKYNESLKNQENQEFQDNQQLDENAEPITSMAVATVDLMSVSNLYNILMSFGVMGSALLLVIFYPKVTKVITLMGGFLSCTMGILYPMLFWIALERKKTKKISCANWALIIIGGALTFFGYFASTITVLDIAGVDLHLPTVEPMHTS